MNRPNIEQFEENLKSFPYGSVGSSVVFDLIDYVKKLEEEIEYLKRNQKTGRLVFGDADF